MSCWVRRNPQLELPVVSVGHMTTTQEEEILTIGTGTVNIRSKTVTGLRSPAASLNIPQWTVNGRSHITLERKSQNEWLRTTLILVVVSSAKTVSNEETFENNLDFSPQIVFLHFFHGLVQMFPRSASFSVLIE